MVHEKHSKESQQEMGLTVTNNSLLAKNSIEAGKSAIGALVGLVVGGPVGAVVGAVTAPVISLAQDIAKNAIERHRLRLEHIVGDAIGLSGLDLDDALLSLSCDDVKADDFLSLLSIASQSDKSLDAVFKGLIAEILCSKTKQQKDRLLIIGDAVRNFRVVHLRILTALAEAGGTLKASEIASIVGISEIELRSVVRDLELRGMIKDLEKRPIEWKLRELGQAITLFVQNNKEE